MKRKLRVRDGRGGAARFIGRAVMGSALALAVNLSGSIALGAEASAGKVAPGNAPTQEWQFLGGTAAHTRYSPAKQITAENFASLKTAWVWDGASFKAQSGRSTPSYMDGKLFTVAGERRYVVAIDPATGESIWSYVEPKTPRYEYSMRKD